jgi:hypothetical protein
MLKNVNIFRVWFWLSIFTMLDDMYRSMRIEVYCVHSGAYLDLLLGVGGDSNFSLIQAQNLQVTFLVIFKSGESLIFVFFFFFF